MIEIIFIFHLDCRLFVNNAMKRLGIIFLILALVQPLLYAFEETIAIGILPFYDLDQKEVSSDELYAELCEAFQPYKFIELTERAQIEDLAKEIKLGMTGLVDPSSAAKLGKIHGMQLVIAGTFSKEKITARIIQVETSKVLGSASVASLVDIDRLVHRLASNIEVFLMRENLKRMRNDPAELDVELWAERETGDRLSVNRTAHIGESIRFMFRSNEDGYVTIVDIQPSGDVVILYPNDFSPNNKVVKGKLYSIPSQEDDFKITVTNPIGLETVICFFTKKKVDWLDRGKLSGEGLWTVKEVEKARLARGLSITASKLKSSEWETKSLEFNVNEK